MEIISPEVASGAGGVTGIVALIKMFYNDWTQRQEKRDVQKRLDQQDDEIASHAVLDAQTFITKDEYQGLRNEYSGLRQHMDDKFAHIETLIISIIKDGAKKEDWRNRSN